MVHGKFIWHDLFLVKSHSTFYLMVSIVQTYSTEVCKNRPECVIFDGFILVTKKAHAAIAWAFLQYCNLKS